MSERARGAEQGLLPTETSLAKRAIIRLSAATRRDGWELQGLHSSWGKMRWESERERERGSLCTLCWWWFCFLTHIHRERAQPTNYIMYMLNSVFPLARSAQRETHLSIFKSVCFPLDVCIYVNGRKKLRFRSRRQNFCQFGWIYSSHSIHIY